jgi:hypothetical protein
MNGQLYNQAALRSGKDQRFVLNRGLHGPQRGCEGFGEEKSRSYPESNKELSVFQAIAEPLQRTAQSRFEIFSILFLAFYFGRFDVNMVDKFFL